MRPLSEFYKLNAQCGGHVWTRVFISGNSDHSPMIFWYQDLQ